MFDLFFYNLATRVNLILLIAFILLHQGMIRNIFTKSSLSNKNIMILSLIFGFMGIFATYTGVKVQGSYINARSINIFVGGLIGGPKVGFLTALIAGTHRYFLDINSFITIPCLITTILEGLLAGYLHQRYRRSKKKAYFAFFWGVLAESLQIIIIILFTRFEPRVLDLVKLIGIPMILANSFGIACFIIIIEQLHKEVDSEAALQSQLALFIADESIKYFRKGYNKETTLKIAKIIKEHSNFEAVSFTNKKIVLSHVGVDEKYHAYGTPIYSNPKISDDLLAKPQIYQSFVNFCCKNHRCKLKSAVVVPLFIEKSIIGYLILYKTKENAISRSDFQLALGLSKLFSTQVELSKIDEQKQLITEAELSALQAQINPHFLFNAINTISVLIRSDTKAAHRALINFSNHYRSIICNSNVDVSIDEELKNVDSYVQIEKARFKDRLNVIYDIDPKINCKLPPLIIQPLVENAIQHGVLNKIEGGTVIISAKTLEDYVKISVIDDGIGINEKKLKNLLSDYKCLKKIGIKNVDKRLKNKYGEQYGLHIDSEEHEGTCIDFKIPLEGEKNVNMYYRR